MKGFVYHFSESLLLFHPVSMIYLNQKYCQDRPKTREKNIGCGDFNSSNSQMLSAACCQVLLALPTTKQPVS